MRKSSIHDLDETPEREYNERISMNARSQAKHCLLAGKGLAKSLCECNEHRGCGAHEVSVHAGELKIYKGEGKRGIRK